jgi:hypothetical protein
MGAAVLTNLIATTVSETAPTLNQNNSLKLGVRDFTDRDANAYLYWTRPFPLKATILSAKLIFYTTAETTPVGTRGFRFNRLAVKFDASKVVYNNRPVTFIAGEKQLTKTIPWVDKTLWELDITDWMQTVANGGAWYGLRVVPTVHEDFALWTDPAIRPRVEITWSDAPNMPGGLSPGGGRAVGLSKPVLKGQYLDVSGSVALQAVRVQINATDTWATPSFDSGNVLASVPELDLATTAYAGLADGATVFWRIQFQDAAGLWSPWSAATSFKRDDKGSLTVNNPPAGTPKVEDATPPIAWTFTGETQSAYQIQIYHLVNNVRIIDWDTGKVTSTITSLTVPAGKINEPTDTTYNVTVRIWDTEQREATPGDPTYVEVVRDFTFIPGATTGSTATTAIADPIRPKVVLTWNAATFPDRFNILRNGTVIAAALDPNDTFVSGTTHSWTDHYAHPGRLLTYEIQRVVGDVASSTNSTAQVTMSMKKAIWLREPVSGLEVPLWGGESPDFTLGETAGVLQAISPDALPVAINQQLGGLEAPVSGTLMESYGQTAQYWRDQYLKIRKLRVKSLALTSGEATIRCVAQKFTYKQRATEEILFDVSFTVFHQESADALLTSA